MKVGKIIGGLVLVLVAVVALVVFVGLGNINSIIKNAVETVGPDVTKTSVTLNRADVQIASGRGELHGLVVGNPAGFNSPHAISIGEVALQIDPASLTGPVYVIKEVLVDGASLIAEQKDLTNSNLQTLLKNVQQGAAKSTQAEETTATSDVRLMVEKFSFINGTAQVITEQWGEKTLKLPNINLANIGDKTTGLTPDQLAQAMLKPVVDQAKRAATEHLQDRLEDEAKDKLKEKLSEKLSEGDREKLDKLKSLFK